MKRFISILLTVILFTALFPEIGIGQTRHRNRFESYHSPNQPDWYKIEGRWFYGVMNLYNKTFYNAVFADTAQFRNPVFFTSDADSFKIQMYKELYALDLEVGNTRIFGVDSTGDGLFVGGDITGANGNAIDIGEAVDGTIAFSRDDAGTVILTSADNDANAALTVSAGGTGALTIGDTGSTSSITSSGWKISATGIATGFGAITADGVLSIDDATDATNTTSGSFHTDGGVGIAKKLYVGTEATFLSNAAAATFGNVLTDADVVLAFDAVTAQGSITYMEDEDRFDFDNDMDVVGASTAGSYASDAGVSGVTADFTGDLYLDATKKVIFADDADDHTFITESSADVLNVTVGGVSAMTITENTTISGSLPGAWDVVGAFTAGSVGSDAAVTATSGVDLGTSQALVGTTALTIGDGTQTVNVNSSDWNITAAGHMTGIGKITTDSTASFGSWGYTGEHVNVPETSSNTNAGVGIYSMVDYAASSGKVFAGSYSRMLVSTTQTNQSTMVGSESQFRLRDVDIGDGVHAGIWAYAEQSGTSELSGAATFNAINATVESEAGFTVGATENISCIIADGSINSGASGTIDANAEYAGLYIKSNGLDFYDGIKITGSTNDIELGDASCIDGSTTNGATLGSATGAVAVNYVGAMNQTVITFTSYAMPITDSGANGGHGSLKLIDFPEGMINVPGVVGDIAITAVTGMDADSEFDMALGSAATEVGDETLGGTEVDFVAKVDGTLVTSADTIDLHTETLQTEDGHGGSTDVWFNVAVPAADCSATGTMTISGTIVITWCNLGDY